MFKGMAYDANYSFEEDNEKECSLLFLALRTPDGDDGDNLVGSPLQWDN